MDNTYTPGWSDTYNESPSPDGYLRQYMFCQAEGGFLPPLNCGATLNNEIYDWYFDQDCLWDINNGIKYANWFIFRILVSQMNIASVD